MKTHSQMFASLFFVVFCLVAGLAPARAQTGALAPLPGTGTLAPATNPNSFDFIVAGDNRPAEKHAVMQHITPCQIFYAISQRRTAFALWTGDTIAGKNPGDQSLVEKQYALFLGMAKFGGVPIFNAPGNHEMDDENDVPNATMQTWYAKIIGLPYGSFDYGNSHFIALNTEEIAPAGTKKSAGAKTASGKTLDPGYVSRAQLDWLQKDLAANKDKAHVFIFMHHPVKPYKASSGLDATSAKALKDVFRQFNNISYVLAGHEHLYYNPQGKKGTDDPPSRFDPTKVGPYYLVTGGAGAPFTSKMPPGSFHHYLVFEVRGSEVKAKLVKVADNAPTFPGSQVYCQAGTK